jgi:hypothetical protein
LNFRELNGKSLALLFAGEDDDWSVLRGIVRQEGEALLLVHNAGEKPFVIQPEWIDRIKSTPADLGDILDADFFLLLSVGALPEDADPSDYIHTGLKLPEWAWVNLTGSITSACS